MSPTFCHCLKPSAWFWCTRCQCGTLLARLRPGNVMLHGGLVWSIREPFVIVVSPSGKCGAHDRGIGVVSERREVQWSILLQEDVWRSHINVEAQAAARSGEEAWHERWRMDMENEHEQATSTLSSFYHCTYCQADAMAPDRGVWLIGALQCAHSSLHG